MTIKRIDVIERFVAVDSDGNRSQVGMMQEIIAAPSLQDPNGEVQGLKMLALADGGRVNYIDDNTFKIVQTDTIIKRA